MDNTVSLLFSPVGRPGYDGHQQSIGCGSVNSVQKRWDPLAARNRLAHMGRAQRCCTHRTPSLQTRL
nr:MAG TPA: hypothetical protein [Caudoviricetes sp.]